MAKDNYSYQKRNKELAKKKKKEEKRKLKIARINTPSIDNEEQVLNENHQ